MQVSEQVLKAFKVETCGGLIAKRGLLAALFSPVSTSFFMAVGLGIGRTQHGEPIEEGAVGRKGISCERTFSAVGAPAELEAKARPSDFFGHFSHIILLSPEAMLALLNQASSGNPSGRVPQSTFLNI